MYGGKTHHFAEQKYVIFVVSAWSFQALKIQGSFARNSWITMRTFHFKKDNQTLPNLN